MSSMSSLRYVPSPVSRRLTWRATCVWTLSRPWPHEDAVDALARRVGSLTSAIDVTASSLTRRDGPDVFQRLKIEKETTHDLV